jgi:BirA family biotin operon repressor/biotin-[acetyl-CoA-carboxylase] ligase
VFGKKVLMLKEDILKILKSDGGYISGEDICSRCHVSRTAVWKAVKRLKEEGYQIDAVRNRGYRLLPGTDVLNNAEIGAVLSGIPFLKEFRFFPTIDSTNKAAKLLAEEGSSGPALVVADEQTAGRGRRGRTWISPPGTGIWMSILLRPDLPAEKSSMITLVSALAVTEGIREVTGVACGIKWPNDIVADGRKICGILTEMSTDMDGISYIVTGIGINANTEEFPPEIAAVASSLKIETGKTVQRVKIIGAVMRKFAVYYEKFVRDGSFQGLKDLYEEYLVNQGREVAVLDPKGEYRGVAEGISDDGELLVRTEDGSVHTVLSGEVSVRGIYSYT